MPQEMLHDFGGKRWTREPKQKRSVLTLNSKILRTWGAELAAVWSQIHNHRVNIKPTMASFVKNTCYITTKFYIMLILGLNLSFIFTFIVHYLGSYQ